MADYKNLTPEDAAALFVSRGESSGYVGPNDEFEFRLLESKPAGEGVSGATSVVIREDDGHAYRVTLTAVRDPLYDDDPYLDDWSEDEDEKEEA